MLFWVKQSEGGIPNHPRPFAVLRVTSERNGQKVASDFLAKELQEGDTLKVGRHRFLRIVK